MSISTIEVAPDIPFNKALYAFYVAGFAIVGGAFVLLTGGSDLRVQQASDASSALSQTLYAVFYVIGTLLLVSMKDARRVLLRNWPLLALPILALLSTLWSPDPALTFRRSTAYLGTILFGISFASVYRPVDGLALVLHGFSLTMVLSVVVALIAPRYGIHQATDASQPEHAGLWRGVFAHRNPLGLWAGITLALLLHYGAQRFMRRTFWLVAVTASAACLVGARSGTGFTVFVLTWSVARTLVVLKTSQRRDLQALSAAFLALLLLALFLSRDQLIPYFLSILGKSSDLTGRTLIWYLVLQDFSQSHALFGYSYAAGYFFIERQIASLNLGTYGSAHNAYIEMLIYLGYPGLALFVTTLCIHLWRGIKLFARTPRDRQQPIEFCLSIVILAIASGFVESFLAVPNNVTMLMSIAAAMLTRLQLDDETAASAGAGQNTPAATADP